MKCSAALRRGNIPSAASPAAIVFSAQMLSWPAPTLKLAQTKNWQTRLKQSLLPLSDKFDFVLIDCPPALGILTINALVAAERVLIPMQCEYFALEGLSDLAETVRRLA